MLMRPSLVTGPDPFTSRGVVRFGYHLVVVGEAGEGADWTTMFPERPWNLVSKPASPAPMT